MGVRTGHIHETQRPHGTYYTATICIGYRNVSRCSYDRSEVEGWLSGMLEEHPYYKTENGRGAGAHRRAASGRGETPAPARTAGRRWAVVAECDPMTAAYHMFLRADWPRPRKVLAVDEVNCIPIAWVADDNRGAGYRTEVEAREAARPMSGGAVAYRVREYTGAWETRDGWRVRRDGR